MNITVQMWKLLEIKGLIELFMYYDADEEGFYCSFTELLEKDWYFKVNKSSVKAEDYNIYKSYFAHDSVFTIYVNESFDLLNNAADSIVFLEYTFAYDYKLHRVIAEGVLKSKVDIEFSQKEPIQTTKKGRKPRSKKQLQKSRLPVGSFLFLKKTD